MMHPIRTARAWWGEILGVACVVGDIQATVRSFRATRASNKELGGTRRTAALVDARRGCAHLTACPPATAPDRQKAEVVYEDDHFTYLCNGLVLSIKAPDFPPSTTVLPEKERTP